MKLLHKILLAFSLSGFWGVIAQTLPTQVQSATQATGQQTGAGAGAGLPLASTGLPPGGAATQGQASGMTRPLLPNAGNLEAPANVPANVPANFRPPLQRTEFQNFVQESTGQALPLFGYNLFDTPAFAPVQNVPVPADYLIGPGDEVLLRVWGAIDVDLRLVVDRNGQVSVPKAGTFTLAGVSAGDLTGALRSQLARVYNNFQLTATVGQMRSLQVFVVGQARRPGAYTLSSLSTLVSALFESGGPSATGSLRKIQLKRDGQTVTTLDLYKFITEGDKSADRRLLPGDVIVIPPAGPRVALMGALDAPAVYELAGSEEPLGKLLAYSGGAPALANPAKVLIERIQAQQGQAPRTVEERALDVQGLQRPVKDGDLVTLTKLRNEFDNAVTLRGSVAEPMRHAYKPGMRVSDLIPDRQALIEPGYYRRKNALVQYDRDGKPASKDQIMPNADPWLSQDATVSGRKVDENSLFTQVKNLFNEINWDYAVIERLDAQGLRPVLIPFNLKEAVIDRKASANPELKPGDVVTIFSIKDIPVSLSKRTQFVRLGGEVQRPGVYQIEPGETLPQIIRRAGGLTPTAYLYGTVFTRETTRKQQKANLDQAIRRFEADATSQAATAAQNVQDADKATVLAQTQAAQKQTLARLRALEPTGRLSLELSPQRPVLPDLLLEDGDQITVPNRSDSVSVFGAVLSESSFMHREGSSVRSYLDRAGLLRDAEPTLSLVIRADGSVEGETSSARTLWGALGGVMDKPLFPGDAIFVPEKVDRRTGYVQFMQGAKDWTQLIYQFGLGAAAYKTLKN